MEGRVPFSDCTNKLQSEHQDNLIGTQAIPKGQWKRMARLQRQQAIKQEKAGKEHLGCMNRKRERDAKEVVQELGMSTTDKKRKASKKVQNLNNTEVKEISPNWSRHIR